MVVSRCSCGSIAALEAVAALDAVSVCAARRPTNPLQHWSCSPVRMITSPSLVYSCFAAAAATGDAATATTSSAAAVSTRGDRWRWCCCGVLRAACDLLPPITAAAAAACAMVLLALALHACPLDDHLLSEHTRRLLLRQCDRAQRGKLCVRVETCASAGAMV